MPQPIIQLEQIRFDPWEKKGLQGLPFGVFIFNFRFSVPDGESSMPQCKLLDASFTDSLGHHWDSVAVHDAAWSNAYISGDAIQLRFGCLELPESADFLIERSHLFLSIGMEAACVRYVYSICHEGPAGLGDLTWNLSIEKVD